LLNYSESAKSAILAAKNHKMKKWNGSKLAEMCQGVFRVN